jgi:hypothetical protein
MTDTDIQSKLAEYEGIVRLLTAKCEELAAENARLRSEKSDALSVCKEMYSDPNAPPALRLKAAGLALPHEVPRLESVPPPLDLVANDPDSTLPLAELVAKRRARQNQLEPPYRVLPGSHDVVLLKGNGSGDSSSND